MSYSISLQNRYVYTLCISIFFIPILWGQKSLSQELRDSVEAVRPFPKNEIALPIYKRINKLSIDEGNRNMQIYSLIYISFFNDALGKTIESDEGTILAFMMAQDTVGIKLDNVIMAYQWMQQLERRKGNLSSSNNINKKYIELELLNGASDVEIGISYMELASGYRIVGDYENTILYSTKAFELFENSPNSTFSKEKDKYFRLFRSLQIRGLAYKDLKEYNKSIEDYEQSINYLKTSKNQNSELGKKYKIDCYSRLAHVLILDGNLKKASNILKLLKPLISKTKHNRFRYYELLSLLSLKNGKLDNTLEYIKKGIELAKIDLKGNNESPEIARLLMINGDYYVKLDSLSLAVEQFHNGLKYYDKSLNDHFNQNPENPKISAGLQTLQLLEKKAETLIKLYTKTNKKKHLFDGISTYKSALKLIDKMKSDFINEGSKYRVTDIASTIFPKVLEANFTNFKLDNSDTILNSIFNIMEKNKAEILFQNITSKYDLITSKLPEDLIEKGIELKYNISHYSKLLSEENQKQNPDKSKIEKFEAKLFKLNEDYTFHDQKIRDQYPKLHTLKKGIEYEASISELKDALQENQIIIEFFQTQEDLFVLSIGKEKVALRRGSLNDIQSLTEKYYIQISNSPVNKANDINDLRKSSLNLAQRLLLEDENYSPEVKKMVVIPDGIINKLPFESLIIDPTGKMLIKQCNVAYNYSANQFLENINSPELQDPEILCLTPTFEGKPSDQRTCNATVLGDLPYVKDEYNFLKKNFNGLFLEAESANRANLEDNFQNYEVVHLATHACLNDQDPMLSQIYFSDGSMTNYDIQNLNSRPELVILSACNTAAGRIRDGEGIIGLSRGFFEAGVKGMQSSLWSIDDHSSSKIVTGMYKYLKQGKSKSESLRQSKLDYLKSADKLRAHPYYWAAMIHIGNDNPIQFSNNNTRLVGIIALTLLILGWCIFIYRKRKLKNS